MHFSAERPGFTIKGPIEMGPDVGISVKTPKGEIYEWRPQKDIPGVRLETPWEFLDYPNKNPIELCERYLCLLNDVVDSFIKEFSVQKDVLAQIQAAISEKLLTAGPRPFAVFDFDNTCIVNDVGEAALAYLCRHKLVKNLTLLAEGEGGAGDYSERVFRRYYEIFGQGKILEAYSFCARAFAGFTPEAATALAQATLEAEGTTPGTDELYGVKIAHGLPVRPQVRQLMEYLSAQGVAVWVVSASSEFAVRAALQHHHLPGQLIGIRNVIKDGILTPLLEEPMSVLAGKPTCIKKFIDPVQSPLVGVGDSMNDLPMLEIASIKVVVDRGNALAQEARTRGWFLLQQPSV